MPLPDPALVTRVGEILDLAFDPQTSAWELAPDGTWSHTKAEDDEPLTDLQAQLIARHSRRRGGPA